jgi:hypothetical protein
LRLQSGQPLEDRRLTNHHREDTDMLKRLPFIAALLLASSAYAVDYQGLYDSVDKPKASEAVDKEKLGDAVSTEGVDYKKAAESVDTEKATEAVDTKKAGEALMK